MICSIIFFGCSTVRETGKNNQSPVFSLNAGYNKGGVVENTDMSAMNNDLAVDACTGATLPGAHIGGHVKIPVGKNSFESGLDLMLNKQTLHYNDDINNYQGERRFLTEQILFPVNYNIGLFRNKYDQGLFQLKLGYVFQINHIQITHESGELPAFRYSNYSNGPYIGLSTIPWQLENGNHLGMYMDVYRGSQIYKDFYNQPEIEAPGSAFFRLGIIYQFGE